MIEARASGLPRLLVVASTYPRWRGDHEPGFVHELAKRLAGRFDVVVLTPHASGAARRECLDGVLVHRYRYAPERMETLVHGGGIVTNLRRHKWKLLLLPAFVAMQAWSLWRIVRRWRPAAIHAHWMLPQGALAAAVAGRDVPVLVTAHGADLYSLDFEPLRTIKRYALRRAARLTVVSRAMAEDVGMLDAGTARPRVMPMGVDLQSRFVPDPAVPRTSDELLFVGRLVEKKGLGVLLEAMPALVERRPSIRLTVVGFGPEEAALRARAEALGVGGRVRFAGPVAQADLPMFYRRAAVFVAPFVQAGDGDREGLGLVLVEALGCGCPVVTTRIPAVREVFDGEWPPFAAEPASVQGLVASILAVLSEHRAACDRVQQGLPALRRRFDWEHVAAAYANLIQDIAMRRQQESS